MNFDIMLIHLMKNTLRLMSNKWQIVVRFDSYSIQSNTVSVYRTANVQSNPSIPLTTR